MFRRAGYKTKSIGALKHLTIKEENRMQLQKSKEPVFQVKRGMVFFIDEPSSKQGVPCNNGIKKSRPYIVISNNLCNAYSQLIHVAPLKTDHDVQKNSEKWYFIQYKGKYGNDYIIDISSIMLVDKIYCNSSSYSESNTRNITDEIMDQVDAGIMRQFELDKKYQKIDTQTVEVKPVAEYNKVESIENVYDDVEDSAIVATVPEVTTETVTPIATITPNTQTIKIDGMEELVKSFAVISQALAQYVGNQNKEQSTENVEDVKSEPETNVSDVPKTGKPKKFNRRTPFTHNERLAFLKDCETMKIAELVEKYSKYGIDTPKKACDARYKYAIMENKTIETKPNPTSTDNTSTHNSKSEKKKHNMCVKFPNNDSMIRQAIAYYDAHSATEFIKKYKKYGFKTSKQVYNFITRNRKKFGKKEAVK